jgi:type II secretory pathway pseudopilin PulG
VQRIHGARSSRTAFTIVELLVTVGIIAALAAMALPALAGARRTALATADLAILRGLAMAHSAYMTLHEERFADVGLPHGSLGNPANSFVVGLQPFLEGDARSLRSPLDTSPHWPTELGGDGEPVNAGSPPLLRRTSYGMNNYLSRSYSPTVALDGAGAGVDRLQQLRDPSRIVCFLLMAERGSYASADHPHVEDWAASPVPARSAAAQVLVNAVDRRTPQAASLGNWAFIDGAVRTMPFEDVYRSVTENRFDPTLD